MVLIHKGKVLTDDVTLTGAGVTEASFIVMMHQKPKAPKPAPPPPAPKPAPPPTPVPPNPAPVPKAANPPPPPPPPGLLPKLAEGAGFDVAAPVNVCVWWVGGLVCMCVHAHAHARLKD